MKLSTEFGGRIAPALALSVLAAVVGTACVSDREIVPAKPAPTPIVALRRISAMEAVAIAEAFIVLNGYTDLPCASDVSQLTPEPIEWSPREEWIQQRHDSLDRAAYGYTPGRKCDEPGWTVVFRQARGASSDTGRAVTMDEFGLDARVMHCGCYFSFVEYRLPSW